MILTRKLQNTVEIIKVNTIKITNLLNDKSKINENKDRGKKVREGIGVKVKFRVFFYLNLGFNFWLQHLL